MVFSSSDPTHEGYFSVKVISQIPQLTTNYEAYFTFEVFLYPSDCLFNVLTPGSALDMTYVIGIDG